MFRPTVAKTVRRIATPSELGDAVVAELLADPNLAPTRFELVTVMLAAGYRWPSELSIMAVLDELVFLERVVRRRRRGTLAFVFRAAPAPRLRLVKS